MLEDDEDVSIMAFSTHESPVGEARREAGQKLEEYLKRIDGQTTRHQELLNEVLKKVRPGYREHE